MQQMDRSNEILTELKESAPYLGKQGQSQIPYSLPRDYFETFPEALMNRIRLEAVKENVPEISPQREIADISGLLAGLKDKNTYQAPEGYFESLNIKIPSFEYGILSGSPVEIQDMAPVIPIGPQKNSESPVPIRSYEKTPVVNFSRVMKYAIAACFVALVGLSLFNLTFHRNKQPDPISGLMTVSEQDMANYLDADDIHWTPGINTSETASIELNDNDIHELFSNVSDDELEQYIPPLPLEKGTVN
jgi:hypothetical protein